jgi:hypothetical protein
MIALPHCGQLQPKSQCTIATRQTGQERVGNSLLSRMLVRCPAPPFPAIQE